LVAADFSSNSPNFRPLSHFITYHKYKIKDKSTKKPFLSRHRELSLRRRGPGGLKGFVMTCGHFLNNGMQVTKVSFKPVLIFQKKRLKIMEEHTVKHGALRMPACVYLCRWHGRQVPPHRQDVDSRPCSWQGN